MASNNPSAIDHSSVSKLGNKIHDDVANEIEGLTSKGTPVDADLLIIEDSAASFVKKKITIGSLPGGGAGSHALLDGSTVTDSNAFTVARGALAYGKGATPKWDGLVVDGSNRILVNDGLDVSWGKVALGTASNISGVLGVSNGGTNSSAALGTANAIMISDGSKIVEGTLRANGTALENVSAIQSNGASVTIDNSSGTDIFTITSSSPAANPAVVALATSVRYTVGGTFANPDLVILGKGSGDIQLTPITGNTRIMAGDLFVDAGSLIVIGTGPHSIGGNADTKQQLTITGTFSPATGTASALFVDTTLNAVANQNTFGTRLKCTLVEAGSGTHTHFNTLQVHAPTITAGGAVVTTASTVRIVAAPTEGVNNYALLVDAGAVKFDETLEVLGKLSVGGDLDFTTSGKSILANGTQVFKLETALVTSQVAHEFKNKVKILEQVAPSAVATFGHIWVKNAAVSNELNFLNDAGTNKPCGVPSFPLWPFSIQPENTAQLWPRVHVTDGSSVRLFGCGADATPTSSNWFAFYALPEILPPGVAKVKMIGIAIAGTGTVLINYKWKDLADGADADLAVGSMNAEGNTTFTWSAGQDNDLKVTKVTLDADTITAGGFLMAYIQFAGGTLAVDSSWWFPIIWEPTF